MRATFWAWALVLAVAAACGGDSTMEEDGSVDAALDSGGPECATDSDCDDGLFCNGAESCEGGACVAGTAPDCADSVDCTLDLCDEETDRCVNVAPDADGDGVRDASCVDGDGTPLGEDCDDSDGNRYPGNREVCDEEDHDEDCDPETFGGIDRDGDGYLDARCCNARPDGTQACGDDCDDVRPNVNPLATEACDGVDNDCNGSIDEGVLVDGYVDADRDGFGDPSMPLTSCPGRAGFVPAGGPTDCDDSDVARNPGQVEICDGVDNDCNGLVDDDPSVVTWYLDVDGDGFGSASSGTVESCAPPAPDARGSYSLLDTDCNDGVAAVNPGAAEVCDAVDNDCNGVADYEIEPGNFEDDDADGLADVACGAPRGVDCDDADPITGGGLAEACDGRDNDCDGSIDEGATDLLWFYDGDGDGHGASADPAHPVVRACSAPPGYVGSGADCDDTDPARRPGATEACNSSDDDCDGSVDEGGVCGCAPGLADCDSDGLCEVNTDSDEGNCGGCGNVCSPGPNGRSALCISGTCQITGCDPGYDNCDDNASTGCETDLTSDPRNCGACGRECPSTGPQVRGARCDFGGCAFDCAPGFADCNGDPGDGCEADLNTDINHCGGCGNVCAGGPAAPACAGGLCGFVCLGGQTEDCDSDGLCETFLGDPANCGGCGTTCMPTTDVGATCDPDPFGRFVCRQFCNPGRADCNSDPADGCETPVSATSCGCPGDPVRDCTMELGGARDIQCAGFEPGSEGVQCVFSECMLGYRDCGGFCADTDTDPRNCGECGVDCGSGMCSGGTCMCGTGLTFCAGAGCVDTTSDPGHCGGCMPCPTGEICVDSTCQPPGGGPCAPPLVDCGTPSDPLCVDTLSDPAHCGGCGIVCPAASDTMKNTGPGPSGCFGGRCEFDCASGYGDCDLDPTNGCETSTSSDSDHCGSCGKRCGEGGLCGLSICDGVRSLSVGPEHTCAVRDGGTVVCWGDNTHGEVDPTAGSMAVPMPFAVTLPGYALDVAVGRDHTCAIVDTGIIEVYCWGRNDKGQLGDTTTMVRTAPVRASLPMSWPEALSLVAGDDHTCAVVRDSMGGRQVACWGDNSVGQIGTGTAGGSVPTPTLTTAPVPAAHLVAGAQHTCAVPVDVASMRELWCWGRNLEGQLGVGSTTNQPSPTSVAGFLPVVGSPSDVQLAAGVAHTCVLANGTDLYCMGSNVDGAFRDDPADSISPVLVSYPSVAPLQGVVAGDQWTCLSYADGHVRCRGDNTSEVVPGVGSPIGWSPVVEVGNAVAELFASGPATHLCALTFAGQVYCWGDATGGKLGTGTTMGTQPPTLVSALTP